jgi:hypothetical protein
MKYKKNYSNKKDTKNELIQSRLTRYTYDLDYETMINSYKQKQKPLGHEIEITL